MRSRLEDLGRLYQLLVKIAENPIFDPNFGETITDLESYKEELHTQLYLLKDDIDECLDISSGRDYLNEDSNN